ncbi:hypothetical protein DKX38_025733 [Salix brachista]|uniref:Yippee domain-containing protein n=1 Tax=Salix brachista TaxID=2182728 RepID=A0A5N5JTI2_9ROSI|nr:hypothetical protein DKX38_025733 [Salix brachista]
MGRIFVVELEGRSYRCKFCGTHLALPDQLVSKGEHHSGSPRGEAAHESNQKYEEGKFVLERGRIVGEMDLSRELFIDTHPE